MKRDVFFLLTVLLCILLNQFVSAETVGNSSITGNMIVDPVTGKLTSQQVSMSIFVQTTFPYIQLISPKNQTYLKNESILLTYTISDGDYVWYNLDNSANTTINSSIYFNVSQGKHILYIFSNKTENVTISNVTFTANSSRFIILYENYKGTYKGASTNFIDYTYEEIQNLENINLENTNYGKIRFNEPINLTDDRVNTDNLLDIDSNIKMSSNHIELNSTEVPNFNKPATLWIYSLNFANPRILKDGVVCPSNECIKEGYTYPSGAGYNGILKFNVTGFSVYSAEETPSTNNTNPPSDRGGGGGTTKEEIINETTNQQKVENITVIPKEIDVSLKQGETKSENLYLINNYNGKMKLKIEVYNIKEFVTVSETDFELSPQESKTIKINFSAGEDTPPDTYIGKILVKTDNGEVYEVLTSINVQSKGSLFDVVLRLDERKLPTVQGGSLWFTTSIYNLGEKKGIDINIKYTIKDSNGKIIFEGEGTDKIDTYLEKNGKIKLPKNIYPGRYILSARVDYEGKTAITSANFDVKKRKLFTILNIIIGIIIIFAILIVLWRTGKKERERIEREKEKKAELLEN
jgi:hypothetical protein